MNLLNLNTVSDSILISELQSRGYITTFLLNIDRVDSVIDYINSDLEEDETIELESHKKREILDEVVSSLASEFFSMVDESIDASIQY